MRRKFTLFRGMKVSIGWPERLRGAQEETTYEIRGVQYARVPYGREGPPFDTRRPCHDCAAVRGELHVPGCDMERCPACGGQAIACGCGCGEDAGPLAQIFRIY